jgi:hypothetical protein
LGASKEYGPLILKIDINTGIVLKKYQPCTDEADLPAVFLKRRANHCMANLSLEIASGKLHGFKQSLLDSRWQNK